MRHKTIKQVKCKSAGSMPYPVFNSLAALHAIEWVKAGCVITLRYSDGEGGD